MMRPIFERRTEPMPTPCSNDGCRRPAAAGETLCDPCHLERALFRRDERSSCRADGTHAERR
jgi:hypothetical protein